MDKTDILIAGGGISGLSLAWWLAQSGYRVEVWEADTRVGGKIKSTQQDGYLMEQAAALLMNFRPEVSGLIHNTGLEAKKICRSQQAKARRYLLHQEQLISLPMNLGGLIRSPLWSLRGKLRLLAEPFMPVGRDPDETVTRFIERRLGREMLEKAMDPFVAGTLAADPDLASAAATLPRLTALEKRYGSITAGIFAHRLLRKRNACLTDTFSFEGGMSTLIDTLANTPGVQVRTGYKLRELTPSPEGWQALAETPHGEYQLHARKTVLATPAPVAAQLLDNLDTDLATLLRGITYAPLAVVHIGMQRKHITHPLDGTGFLTPRNAGLPINGNLWMSSLFSGRAPQGNALMTTYLGGSRRPELVERDDNHLLNQTLQSLQPLLGLQGDPEMVRIQRHSHGLPVYHGAYQARLQAIEKKVRCLPNLYLEANYQGGVSVRDRITRSCMLAQRIAAELPVTKTYDQKEHYTHSLATESR